MKKILQLVFFLLLGLNITNQKAIAQAPLINMHSGSETVCIAQFYDDGGPAANYSNGITDTLTFYPVNPGTKLCVTFHAFNTEEAGDYLDVRNGNSIAAPLIRSLTGGIKYGSIKSTATDGSLTFVFRSNALNNNFAGWYATITTDTMPEEITTIASGVWYTSSGRFMDSGGEGFDYDNDAQVNTTIYPENPGDKISVTFHTCEINPTDLLYVFNGNSVSSPIIAVLTGSSNLGTITSSDPTGALTFRFESSPNTTDAGWIASISVNAKPEDITTLADQVYTVSSGRFFDNGGEFENYADNRTTTITMLPQNAGDKVNVTFHECNIATGDFLYVYNGTSVSAPLLGVISGINYGTVSSTDASGGLTFRFVAGPNGSAFGWDASITTNLNPEDITMMCSGIYTVGCMGRFFDNGGPQNYYEDNQHTVTTLNPATAGGHVSVTFHSFNTQLNTDILYVYNGADTNATLIGSYSGDLTVFTVTSTAPSGNLTFKFISNANTSNYGWYASITCNGTLPSYNITPNTTNTYTTDGGFFYDDGGPNADYSNGQNVPATPSVITFNPLTPNSKVSVSFNYFYTDNQNDYLEVYDGSNQFAPVMIRLSQIGAYGTITATNPGGSLTFKFVSDAGYTKGGWAAIVSVDASPQIISLPGVYTANNGFYTDAGGPAGNYMDNSDFVSTILPVGGIGKVSVSFTHFYTDNAGDYIEVHDGTSITDSVIAVLYGLSGYGTITASGANTSGALTFRFVSNAGYSAPGWSAIISNNAAPQNISLPGTFTVSNGIYTDPGGPYAVYENNLDRITIIKPATTGSKVSISFGYFNTDSYDDYIEVHDGENITDPVLARLSYNNGYGTITASPSNTSGSLTCRFVTNGGYSHAGWVGMISNTATPKNISLPGIYETNSGYFYDQGGPSYAYYINNNDVTTLKPIGGIGKLSLAFSYFSTDYVNDSLQIFDGNSVTAPLIGTYYQTNSPGTVTSTAADGSLTFRTITNGGYVDIGWAAAITVNINCWLGGVGINEQTLSNADINLYPNPSYGQLTVELAEYKNQPVELSIYTMAGQKLMSKIITQQKSELQLNYPNGIYMAKLGNAQQNITKKLVIQH